MSSKVIYVVLAILCSALTTSAQTRRKVSPSPGQYQIRFDDQLHVSRDLKLYGNVSSESVRFTCESGWKPVQGSRLHLFIEHSPGLDSNRSFLSISLNYGILRSLRLDEQNEKLTEVVVPLPGDLLKVENELVFSIEQFAATKDSSTSIWTEVSLQSYILIQYEARQPQFDFHLLPSPLLDAYSYRPKKLALLLPEQVSSETLEATALLVANFCNRVAPEPVLVNVVRSMPSVQEPLLIVGTPQEQPKLQVLQGRSPVVLYNMRGRRLVGLRNGEILNESEGVAGLTTITDDLHPVLFVSGNSPSGVLRAARNLVIANSQLSGNFARISQDANWVAQKPREWKGFIPPRNRFTLADLGLKPLKISSAKDFSVLIPLNATPDAQFLNYGHQMVLSFKLEVDLSAADAHLEVHFNDAVLGRFAVREISKGSMASLPLKVPAHLLRLQNLLKIVWLGALPESGGQGSVGWLLPNSEFYLPRDYGAELPDLSLLQFHLYPFSVKANLSDTIILIPNRLNEAMISLLVELSSLLGRLLPTDQLAFGVRQMAELTQEQKSSSNFIFLGIDNFDNRLERVFPNWKPLPWIESLKGQPNVRETVSPWNSRKYVLGLTANSITALQQAVRHCFSETISRQLKGDAAYLTSSRPICFTLASRQKIQEYSYLAHMEAWLRVNWIALPIILGLVSGLLFIGLRLALHHYKSGRAAV